MSTRSEREEKRWRELEAIAEDEVDLINAILNTDIAINTWHCVEKCCKK